MLGVSPDGAIPAAAHFVSEIQFRQFFESLKDYAIMTLDAGGHITSWNEGATRIDGYVAREIVGKDFSVLYPPEDIRQGKPGHQLKRAATSRLLKSAP